MKRKGTLRIGGFKLLEGFKRMLQEIHPGWGDGFPTLRKYEMSYFLLPDLLPLHPI